MPRETGNGNESREQRGETGQPDDRQRIETEKPDRDRAMKEWNASHDPSEAWERAARPLPTDYGTDRPRHRDIPPEVADELGITVEHAQTLRAKMFDDIDARTCSDVSDETARSADTSGQGTDPQQEPASTGETTAQPYADLDARPEAGSSTQRDNPPTWGLHTRIGEGKDAPFVKQVLDRNAGPEGLSTEQRVADEEHIMTHAKHRPWLYVAANQEPEVRHVYCERDRAEGHDPARHDGWRDATDQEQRTAAGKDPAHPTDSPAYHNSVDHLDGTPPPDDIGGKGKQHTPGERSTWIDDPTAWAVATVRAMEHPDVKQAFASDNPRRKIEVPLEDVLGEDGHRKCDGYALVTDGFSSTKEAVRNRDNWVAEVREVVRGHAVDRDQAEAIVERKSANGDIQWVKPEVKRIETFEGGTCQINLKVRNYVAEGVTTICYNPPTDQRKGTT